MSTLAKQRGFTLIEVLVTFLIVAIGLLGLGALQINTMNNSFETYQRALVASIVDDMAARIRMNAGAAMAGEYFLAKPQSTTCSEMMGSQRDLCEWHAQITARRLALMMAPLVKRAQPGATGTRGC